MAGLVYRMGWKRETLASETQEGSLILRRRLGIRKVWSRRWRGIEMEGDGKSKRYFLSEREHEKNELQIGNDGGDRAAESERPSWGW